MAKAGRGRPKKTTGTLKSGYLQVRVGDAEKETFDTAAELAGLPLSAWVRERLRAIARKELEHHGKKPVF